MTEIFVDVVVVVGGGGVILLCTDCEVTDRTSRTARTTMHSLLLVSLQ